MSIHRKSLFLLLVVLGLPAFALSTPCSPISVTPPEAFAVPNNVVVLGGQRPQGLCTFQITTSTPDVISVDSVTTNGTAVTIRVTTLAPGEGIVIASGYLAGGIGYSKVASTIHVDSCSDGAHSIVLAPSYATQPGKALRIEPVITGSFPRGFAWLVNGTPWSTASYLDFVPQSNGTYRITLRAESLCGILETSAFVMVGPQRTHAVRRR